MVYVMLCKNTAIMGGAIAEGYERWLHKSPIQQHIGRPVQLAWHTIKHRRENQYHMANIQTGPRLFSESDSR